MLRALPRGADRVVFGRDTVADDPGRSSRRDAVLESAEALRRTAELIADPGVPAVFEGAFVLKRADYGIGEGMWADFGTVANEVQIKFRLVAAPAPDKK